MRMTKQHVYFIGDLDYADLSARGVMQYNNDALKKHTQAMNDELQKKDAELVCRL